MDLVTIELLEKHEVQIEVLSHRKTKMHFLVNSLLVP